MEHLFDMDNWIIDDESVNKIKTKKETSSTGGWEWMILNYSNFLTYDLLRGWHDIFVLRFCRWFLLNQVCRAFFQFCLVVFFRECLVAFRAVWRVLKNFAYTFELESEWAKQELMNKNREKHMDMEKINMTIRNRNLGFNHNRGAYDMPNASKSSGF